MATYGRSINTNLNFQPFTNSGHDIQIELEGEWVKADRLFNYFTGAQGQAIKRDIAKATRDFAEKLKKTLIMGLMTEGSSIGQAWAPHSASYSRWLKYHKSLSENGILTLTGNYLRALQGAKITQKNYQISLTLNRGDILRKAHPKGVSLGQYAVINEMGSSARGIPARKLWGPSFESLGGQKGLLKYITWGVGRRMNTLGIPINVSPPPN